MLTDVNPVWPKERTGTGGVLVLFLRTYVRRVFKGNHNPLPLAA